MARLSKETPITDNTRADFVALQVWAGSRDILKKVADKRRMAVCLLVDNLAKRAEKESFRDEAE